MLAVVNFLPQNDLFLKRTLLVSMVCSDTGWRRSFNASVTPINFKSEFEINTSKH